MIPLFRHAPTEKPSVKNWRDKMMKSINDKKLNTISTGDISLVTDSVSDFIKWLADTGHPAFKSTRDLPPALNALKIKLTTHFASNIECEKTIEYLKHLATYPDNYCLFDII